MTTVEKISQQTRNLPEIYQMEVLDFVEYLENKVRIKTGDEFQIEEQQRLEDLGKPKDFWESPSLEELAVSQGVKPIADLNIIAGTWPGEDNDGFEEDILALRKANKIGSKSLQNTGDHNPI